MVRSCALMLAVLSLGFGAVGVSAAESRDSVSTQGVGAVYAVPDKATLRGSVMAESQSVAEAMSEVSRRLASVLDFLKSQSLPKEAINAAQVRVSPQWHYPRNEPRRLSGYQAVVTFSAELKQLDDVGLVLAGLLENGASELQPAQYDFSRRSELQEQALEAAVKDAKRKAQVALAALGHQVGQVTQLTVMEGGGFAPVARAESMVLRASAVPEVPVALGEQAITMRVSASFAIAP